MTDILHYARVYGLSPKPYATAAWEPIGTYDETLAELRTRKEPLYIVKVLVQQV